MNNRDCLERIRNSAVIAIMRARSSEKLLDAADAIRAGGIDAIEVTLTTPGALSLIGSAVARFGEDVLFGAGSVLDPESARAAILEGAQFIVCPTLKVETIEVCKRYSIPILPGAYTPTEILTAWEAGADIVKVFPANLGGPAYFSSVKAPLPHVILAAVGGVDLGNAADFIRAGAEVIGVGSTLLRQDLLDAKDLDGIKKVAEHFRTEVDKGRSGTS